MIEFTNEDKKNIKIAAIILGISILLSIALLIINHGSNNLSDADKVAKQLGESYYEQELYSSLSVNGTSLLALLKDDGYKVNLQTLLNDNSEYLSYFVSDDSACDLENSYIMIYPKRPYKQGSYKIKVYMDCE